MTALHVLYISSALSWLLLIGLAVSVVRLEKLIVRRLAAKEPAGDGPEIGSVAPELVSDEPSVVGGSLDAVGRLPRLIWFMTTDCTPCRDIRHLVAAIASEYEGSVKCLVNCGGRPDAVAEFAQGWGPLVSTVVDQERVNANRWKIRRVPSVVLVGDDGMVEWKGRPSLESLRGALDATVPQGASTARLAANPR